MYLLFALILPDTFTMLKNDILATSVRTTNRSHHLIEWIFQVVILTIYILGVGYYFIQAWSEFGTLEKLSNTFIAVAMPLLFYSNVYWLIPAFLSQKKWGTYLGLLIGCFVLLTVLYAFSLALLRTQPGLSFFAAFSQYVLRADLATGPLSLSLILSYAYRFTRDWLVQRSHIEQLKTEKTSAELAFLRSQIDPHFLFNMLNTLYATALEEESFETADGIARLGSLLRYTLNDAQEAYLPLSKEIEFLEQYIALQQLRLSTINTIEWDFPNDEASVDQWTIAPMLLLPFVENAFKYGTSSTTPSHILIKLHIQNENLCFTVENSIAHQPPGTSSTGIGLDNVKNRLRLLYPQRHAFSQEKQDDIFRINLELHLAS